MVINQVMSGIPSETRASLVVVPRFMPEQLPANLRSVMAESQTQKQQGDTNLATLLNYNQLD